MIDNRNFDRFFARTPLTLLHFSMPDFDTWYAKVLQRAKAYKFTMATQCAGVRRGQRYCRSFQKLRGGAAPREIARTEYADVCGAIAAQQRETGGARRGFQGGLGSLADVRCVGRDNNNTRFNSPCSPPVEALFRADRPLELLLLSVRAGADLDGVLRRVVRPRQADEDDAQRRYRRVPFAHRPRHATPSRPPRRRASCPGVSSTGGASGARRRLACRR